MGGRCNLHGHVRALMFRFLFYKVGFHQLQPPVRCNLWINHL